jgi:hypothetical protein
VNSGTPWREVDELPLDPLHSPTAAAGSLAWAGSAVEAGQGGGKGCRELRARADAELPVVPRYGRLSST